MIELRSGVGGHDNSLFSVSRSVEVPDCFIGEQGPEEECEVAFEGSLYGSGDYYTLAKARAPSAHNLAFRAT